MRCFVKECSSFFETSHDQDFNRGRSPFWNSIRGFTLINKQCWVTAYGYFLVPFLQTMDTCIQELTIEVYPALNNKSSLLVPVPARSPLRLILFCLVFKFNYQCSRNSESKKGVSPFFKQPIIILASVSILIRVFSIVCYYSSCEVGVFPVSLSLHDPRYTKDWHFFDHIQFAPLAVVRTHCAQLTEIEGAWASFFCVSSLICNLFLSSYSGEKIGTQLRLFFSFKYLHIFYLCWCLGLLSISFHSA